MAISRTRVFLLLVSLLLITQAYAIHQTRGDYTIAVGGSTISVTLDTVFQENITRNPTPDYSLRLVGSNASIAQAAFSSALSKIVPGVTVSHLQIDSSSSGNLTRMIAKFDVEGSATSSSGYVKLNLAWKSFIITEDLQAGGTSVNLVGRYLASSPVLNNHSSSLIAWSYFLDGLQIGNTDSGLVASSFNLIDLSRLSAPLSSWPGKFSPDAGGTTTLSNSESHNMTAKETINEPTTPLRTIFFAGYHHNVQVTISGFARVLRDTVVVDAGGLTTGTMLALAASFPIVGLAGFLIESRISRNRGSPAQKKARQKQRT